MGNDPRQFSSGGGKDHVFIAAFIVGLLLFIYALSMIVAMIREALR